ncbi:peptide chain release factor 1 [Cellulomonas sp. zg-Y908]|uniref:Peptide chain release factor 1 n=2 Tax=Cellulomonas wangsupingiae TaxID=2968085 RepID=A0ABY5K6U6_9CELL|nr:peptide chain release factor 1 [Cellulomonas wangsupingiae]MCC2334507.1 peptide chain release factor 1 [Cellulomonas wangsupingiae]UUI66166.1 peptide chain release factor 1 [Cellulomonas wangsupingiae]
MVVSARAPALSLCAGRPARAGSRSVGGQQVEQLDAVEAMLAEHAQIERDLSDPSVHADAGRARRLGRRYAELGRVVQAYRQWRAAADDAQAAAELAAEDAGFAAELPALQAAAAESAERLHRVLVPRDPDDGRDAILEIKAGEGGEESALFAGDLLRMYTRYAERQGWSVQVLDLTPSDLGGVKDVQVAVKARTAGPPEDGVWAHLKYEGGVHRVQRVPVTESQGRIHTSAAGVMVFPEADDDGDVDIDQNDLRIDVYRSSGPGGQSVNTTDSAVRITHVPTGIVVSMQNEKSQLQNREQAMRVLRARLLAARQEEAAAAASEARRSQVRTVDRSERIRTYNFPENRIADHRTGFKAYNLDQVLDGDLGPVIASALEADEAARLAAAGGVPA